MLFVHVLLVSYIARFMPIWAVHSDDTIASRLVNRSDFQQEKLPEVTIWGGKVTVLI